MREIVILLFQEDRKLAEIDLSVWWGIENNLPHQTHLLRGDGVTAQRPKAGNEFCFANWTISVCIELVEYLSTK